MSNNPGLAAVRAAALNTSAAVLTPPEQSAPAAAAEQTVAKSLHDKLIAETATASIASERKRIGEILGSDEAKGRDDLAREIAFETDMSAETAKKILAKAETKQPAAQPANPLAAAMDNLKNPSVGADAVTEGDQSEDQKAANLAKSIVGDFRSHHSAAKH